MKTFTINKICCLLIAIVSLIGCSQDDLLLYKEDARIYFERGQIVDYTFSISSADVVTDTIYIPLRIMGSAADKDRTFNVIVDDSSTAKKGYHFEFGPQVIAANSYDVSLPVYVYRKPGLKDSIVNAYLTIGESADFKPGYSDKAYTSDSLNKLHYRISINDQLLKPSNWDTRWASYFGTYSRTKHLFIIQTYGGPGWTSVSYPQDINFLVQSVKFALYNYELANGPLIDENGERVVFP